jgi:hypothetical protein
MRRILALIVLFTVAALALLNTDALFAQVPPHAPGTICYTPDFWCWAPVPGAPGAPCQCPTQYGWVWGTLG